eukprot:scaffold2199_cov163-Amphora_coffeaeformis.AAC.6
MSAKKSAEMSAKKNIFNFGNPWSVEKDDRDRVKQTMIQKQGATVYVKQQPLPQYRQPTVSQKKSSAKAPRTKQTIWFPMKTEVAPTIPARYQNPPPVPIRRPPPVQLSTKRGKSGKSSSKQQNLRGKGKSRKSKQGKHNIYAKEQHKGGRGMMMMKDKGKSRSTGKMGMMHMSRNKGKSGTITEGKGRRRRPIPETESPTATPTAAPTSMPTLTPSVEPSTSMFPSGMPSLSAIPSNEPSIGSETESPTAMPTTLPPSNQPSVFPSVFPSILPSALPSDSPSLGDIGAVDSPVLFQPTDIPSTVPSKWPSVWPSEVPSSSMDDDSDSPIFIPTTPPSAVAVASPVLFQPTDFPSAVPSKWPSVWPSEVPSSSNDSEMLSLPSMIPSEWPSVRITDSPNVLGAIESSSPVTMFLSDVPPRGGPSPTAPSTVGNAPSSGGTRGGYSPSVSTTVGVAAPSLSDKVTGGRHVITINTGEDKTIANFDFADGVLEGPTYPFVFVEETQEHQQRQFLLRFDLDEIPANAEIYRARLQLTGMSTSLPIRIRMHRLLVSWDEETAEGDVFGSSGGALIQTDDIEARAIPSAYFQGRDRARPMLEVPGEVQFWVDNPDKNFGWVFLADEGEIGKWGMWGVDGVFGPELLVEYFVP